MTAVRERGAGPASSSAAQTVNGFLQQIHHSGLLRSVVAASDVANAVLCALLLSIPREQARAFVAAIPPTLQTPLHICAVERRANAEIAGREQVLRTIAHRLRIAPEGAEHVARLVLAAAQNWLPRTELENLRRQLAPELSDLWTPP